MAFRRLVSGLCGLLVGCDLGGDVEHDGQYGFSVPPGLPSSVTRPLERMLVIEADGAAGRTLYYFFEGELGEAGIGLEDLRWLAARFSRFEMRFDTPPERYPLWEGGAGGDGGGPAAERHSLELEVDGESVALSELTLEELGVTGASRFAFTLGGARAYFGIRPSAAGFAALELGSPRGKLAYAPELAESRFEIERTSEALRLDYGSLLRADYVEVDFFQRLIRESDEAALDGSLRVSSWPEWPTVALNELLENASAQGCWAGDQPLSVRVTQIARSYTAGDSSDYAVVFRRLDTQPVEAETWARGLALPKSFPYCESFGSATAP